MHYIPRDMGNTFLALSKQYPALLATGPRQVGKTTMLRNLMQGSDRKYVSLDDLNDRMLAKSDPAMFFQLYKPPVLVDEVQYAPELFPYVKIIADREGRPGDFWLTGSQIFKLMRGVRESLAGRVALLSLSSLSQNEIIGRGANTPFTTDFLALLERQERTPEPAGVVEIFQRIHRAECPPS